MNSFCATVSLNLDHSILQTCLPLLQAEQVDAIEWSWDTLYQLGNATPDWFEALLQEFGAEQRLIGHGVFYSMFSGQWSDAQTQWLELLRTTSQRYPFDHITEHFGFFTGSDFHKGAPISVPFSNRTLRIGRDRLARMHEAAQCPIGIENLAIAYSLQEVQKHGAFLNALVEPTNGFMILDLHNIYCQVHNFRIDFDQLIQSYPLERVREIHLSGGSWQPLREHPDVLMRRDTHDDGVPEVVFQMLQEMIPRCSNLKYVVMEQLGNALTSSEQQKQFQSDFLKMRSILLQFERSTSLSNSFLPNKLPQLNGRPIEDLDLYHEQLALSNILEHAFDTTDALERLKKSKLANSAWQIESWAPEMIETCMQIAQKWKKGWNN